MSNESSDIIAAYNNIVYAMNDMIGRPWEFIFLNLEAIEGESGSPIFDQLAFVIFRSNDGFVSEQIVLSMDLEDQFLALRQQVNDSEGQPWSTCDLSIDKSGRYEFDYDYEKPKRLNGIKDEQSWQRFNHPVEEYKRRKLRLMQS